MMKLVLFRAPKLERREVGRNGYLGRVVSEVADLVTAPMPARKKQTSEWAILFSFPQRQQRWVVAVIASKRKLNVYVSWNKSTTFFAFYVRLQSKNTHSSTHTCMAREKSESFYQVLFFPF